MNIKTSHLTITTFSLDMAQSVCENSQDDDIRRFVPDEVYNSAEEAREAIYFLISRYDTTDGPFVYPIITNDSGKNIGYIQRGGSPNMQDRILAARFGAKAVELLKNDAESCVVGIKDNKVITATFEEVATAKKKVDKELYELAHVLSL